MKDIVLMIVKFNLVLSIYLISYLVVCGIHKLGFKRFWKDIKHDKYLWGIILIFLISPMQIMLIAIGQASANIRKACKKAQEYAKNE
jgi:multisubunit Na+/H+ antiporter MnhG subunit